MNSKNPDNRNEKHGVLTRFFLRHAAFLMRLYGTREYEATWHYSTMFVTIVLSAHMIFLLAIIATFLPGRFNLRDLSPNEMGIGIVVVLAAIAVYVDVRFRAFRFNLEAARKYEKGSDGMKLVLTVLSMLVAIAGYGTLLWYVK